MHLDTHPRNHFRPHQMVCLPYQGQYLYAEVIQTITERGLCWVRPLVLLYGSEESHEQFVDIENAIIQDLRSGSDLLCPCVLFRAALDTEIIPILMRLNTLKASEPNTSLEERATAAQQSLQSFLARIWSAQPALFKAQSKSKPEDL